VLGYCSTLEEGHCEGCPRSMAVPDCAGAEPIKSHKVNSSLRVFRPSKMLPCLTMLGMREELHVMWGSQESAETTFVR
jgi:hypothetical protein